MQCPQISDEKKKIASLTNNFWSFKKRIKKYSSMEQNLFFFHQKSEGIAFTFCRYLYQNMRAFIFCRYCPPIVFCPQIWKTKKSSKIEGNTLGILRRSFFPFNALGMPSFNNSVFCLPHWPNFSDIFDLCLHWVSVVRELSYYNDSQECKTLSKLFNLDHNGAFKTLWG